METILSLYTTAIIAVGITGGLLLVQLLVVDVVGIMAGHVPGTPVPSNHDNFMFRAARAHANTNESVSSFILLMAFAMLSSAPPSWVNGLSLLYVAGRVAHMCFYYANMKILRSVSFGISLLALLGILGAGIAAWL
ncbi:MAG: hypothetical protein COA74_10665 [Gammaproteobacteria bacterium]|nr:MAG: hypothetical protein COA74_10665 [Gammaproteobacteria bacterium]